MHSEAENFVVKADEIFTSQKSISKLIGNMGHDFSGKLPTLMTQNMLAMDKKYQSINDILKEYSGFIHHAAERYDEDQTYLAGLAGMLGVAVPGLAGGTATGGGITPGNSGGMTTIRADLNSEYYSNKFPRINPKTGLMNCTCYCYGRALEKTGVELAGCSGNANTWLNQAKNSGLPTGTEIKPNSVAVFGSNDSNHVVFIEDVEYGADGTPKSIVISEGNWNDGSGDGTLKSMDYNKFIESRGNPSGYIYTS
jgi:surface antigen